MKNTWSKRQWLLESLRTVGWLECASQESPDFEQHNSSSIVTRLKLPLLQAFQASQASQVVSLQRWFSPVFSAGKEKLLRDVQVSGA